MTSKLCKRGHLQKTRLLDEACEGALSAWNDIAGQGQPVKTNCLNLAPGNSGLAPCDAYFTESACGRPFMFPYLGSLHRASAKMLLQTFSIIGMSSYSNGLVKIDVGLSMNVARSLNNNSTADIQHLLIRLIQH